MNIDDLPAQFEEFVDRARGILNQHIAEARKVAAAADAKESSAQNALTNLQAQIKSAEDQLALVKNYVDRGSALSSLDQEITAQRKANEALEARKKALELSIAGLEQAEQQKRARNAALDDETRRLVAIRSEGEQFMRDLRIKLQTPLGAQS